MNETTAVGTFVDVKKIIDKHEKSLLVNIIFEMLVFNMLVIVDVLDFNSS